MTDSSPSPKVCVIGLDGATFTVLDKWLASGDMPHLARLIERGCRGTLTSTVPPVTGPAWTSLSTGVNPGVHGVLDFFQRTSDLSSLIPARAGDVPVPHFWDLASAHGRKVGVFNVPLTFPAWPVNGFMISGMMTPGPVKEMAYPQAAFEQLCRRELLPFDHRVAKARSRRAARDLVARLRRDTEAAAWLLEEYRPDALMSVFTQTDQMQHYFWNYCDRAGGGPDAGLAGLARQFYQAVDQTIGRLTRFFGDEATYYVVSDHGFGPLLAECHINYYLAQRGFLKLKTASLKASTVRRRMLAGLSKCLRTLRLSHPILAVLSRVAPGLVDRLFQARRPFDPGTMVDWAGTRALAISDFDCGLHVNLRGRDPQGIVAPGAEYDRLMEELAAALREIPDPPAGKVDIRLMPREQALSGPLIHNAPDVFVTLGDGTVGQSCSARPPLFTESHWCGTHRMDGVLVAAGPGIQPGGRVNAHITDVAPMVLHAMGLAIPPHMEGRVRHELFEPGWLAGHPVRIAAESGQGGQPRAASSPLTAEQQKAVIEQLKRLGYM